MDSVKGSHKAAKTAKPKEEGEQNVSIGGPKIAVNKQTKKNDHSVVQNAKSPAIGKGLSVVCILN